MDEATATFFYGRRGMQRLQDMVGACKTAGRPFMQPPPSFVCSDTTIPLLSQLIKATIPPTYTAYHGVMQVPQAQVSVMAGGAVREKPVVRVIVRVIERVEQDVQQVSAQVTPAEANYVTECYQEVTKTLDSITWNWSSSNPHMQTHQMEQLFRQQADRRTVEQLLQMTTLVLQVLEKHNQRTIQDLLVPRDNAYDSNYSIVNTFINQELYRWWQAWNSKNTKTYTTKLLETTRAVATKQANVTRALVTMNDVLDDDTKWEEPKNFISKACSYLVNKARRGVFSWFICALLSLMKQVAQDNQFDQYVLQIVGITPETIFGNIGSFLQDSLPFVHTQLKHMIDKSGTVPTDARLTHEHFKVFMQTQLILFIADYITQSLGIPRQYLVVALALSAVAITLSTVAIQFAADKTINALMSVANLTRVVSTFDRRLWSNGIMNLNNFQYKCVHGNCQVVNTYLLPRDDTDRLFDSRRECVANCTIYID